MSLWIERTFYVYSMCVCDRPGWYILIYLSLCDGKSTHLHTQLSNEFFVNHTHTCMHTCTWIHQHAHNAHTLTLLPLLHFLISCQWHVSPGHIMFSCLLFIHVPNCTCNYILVGSDCCQLTGWFFMLVVNNGFVFNIAGSCFLIPVNGQSVPTIRKWRTDTWYV